MLQRYKGACCWASILCFLERPGVANDNRKQTGAVASSTATLQALQALIAIVLTTLGDSTLPCGCLDHVTRDQTPQAPTTAKEASSALALLAKASAGVSAGEAFPLSLVRHGPSRWKQTLRMSTVCNVQPMVCAEDCAENSRKRTELSRDSSAHLEEFGALAPCLEEFVTCLEESVM